MRRNGIDRSYGVDYRSDGAVINASMPLSPGRSFSVPTELIRGTVDQLTAYFLLERQLAQRGTCALVVPVFDGSALYNLRFTDIKSDALSADSYQNFAGPTRLCQVVREEIRHNPGQGEDTYQRGKIWYARLTGRRSDAAGTDGIRDCFRHCERLSGGITRARCAPPSDAGMSNYRSLAPSGRIRCFDPRHLRHRRPCLMQVKVARTPVASCGRRHGIAG